MRFMIQATVAVKDNGWDGKDETDESTLQWTFAGALLYALTVVTTIGNIIALCGTFHFVALTFRHHLICRFKVCAMRPSLLLCRDVIALPLGCIVIVFRQLSSVRWSRAVRNRDVSRPTQVKRVDWHCAVGRCLLSKRGLVSAIGVPSTSCSQADCWHA